MNREPIDITGLDKWQLLANLCNGTAVLGLGAMNTKAHQTITADDVYQLVSEGPDREVLNFDYLFGRPLKITIEVVDKKLLLQYSYLYDRDAGAGRCQEIVDALRASA